MTKRRQVSQTTLCWTELKWARLQPQHKRSWVASWKVMARTFVLACMFVGWPVGRSWSGVRPVWNDGSKWGPPSGAEKWQLYEEHTNTEMKKNTLCETLVLEYFYTWLQVPWLQWEAFLQNWKCCGCSETHFCKTESAVAAVGSISAKLRVLRLQ